MVLGKIYKIVNSVDNLIYIGSTKQPLSKRIALHRSNSKKEPNRKLYAHFAFHGIENFRIVLIENYEYTTKDQLLAREDHHIQLNNTIKHGLNGKGAIFNMVQRKQYHKEYSKQYEKTDKCKTTRKAYSQTDKHKQYQKAYSQTDKHKQYQKEYQKEYRKEYNKTIHICECGKSCLLQKKSRHIKTNQHVQFQSLVEFIQN